MLDIYKTRYQLNDHPFRLGPDHRFSLDHHSYASAKAYLEYAISQGEGFIAITGEPGTGKTTLIHGLLAGLDKKRIQVATLTCAQLDPRSLIEMVATSFGLPRNEGSKASQLAELEVFLIKQSRNGRHAILIVDEAQGMSPDSLEEFRLLSNMQHDNRLLLQVFLVGQDHLLDMIHAPGMEHLQQRLIAASHLEPLDLEETVTYVEYRLCHVGWQGDPAITEDALRLVHKFSGGVPRRINLICHRLFLYGGLGNKHELVGEDVRHIVEELHNERVLVLPDKFPGNLSGEEVEAGPRDADALALSLPRKGSFVSAEQLGQRSIPPQPEAHTTESTQQARSVSPEPESTDNKQSIHPLTERELRIRGANESLQAESEEPAMRSGQSMGWRLMMAFALLVGLIFVVAIETGISDRLMGFIYPASVEISNPASIAVSEPEKKAVVVNTGSGATAIHGPDQIHADDAARSQDVP